MPESVSHYAVKWKNELFPTVVVVNIPFSSDRREMFSEQIHTAAESVLNNSLRSVGKGMFTTTTVGKSSPFKKYKGMTAQCPDHTWGSHSFGTDS